MASHEVFTGYALYDARRWALTILAYIRVRDIGMLLSEPAAVEQTPVVVPLRRRPVERANNGTDGDSAGRAASGGSDPRFITRRDGSVDWISSFWTKVKSKGMTRAQIKIVLEKASGSFETAYKLLI
ncbi:MAG: hypothetical protein U9R25_04000 [Chloroflexota bacterium]|nr:hypothetical protein [Chloroflexota bacterium]